ncbi:hypothetical protein EA462_00580 [Natrarchaeobius halalkaliphilus]|uniref:Uncharacterized protein n=1 Tax=Natrarchaeobius halalkaliphilus TaxID=1679091 RepID=A0A3N6N3P6_9EURY|nr:hypothetical protein [Natrarchaeobius halalkaliphilus]RQG92762.1 hypothetical protein EA462_00580 [Natrarchaeobius halalkaliphilus]
MWPPDSPLLALAGLAITVAVFAVVYWDATRIEMGRPLLWASITASTCAVGVGLYVFVPTAPLTGVLLTANTGPVLYGFEREVTTETDEPAEPGTLPHQK